MVVVGSSLALHRHAGARPGSLNAGATTLGLGDALPGSKIAPQHLERPRHRGAIEPVAPVRWSCEAGARSMESLMLGPRAGTACADATRIFYETNAEAYALSTLHGGMGVHHREFAASVLPYATVLDLGCGGGRDLVALSAVGLSPIGLDYSAAMVRLAMRVSRCPVALADMRSIPFADATMDGIWATASLLHLSRGELGQALEECRRVLKPGGILYASVKSGVGEGLADDGRYFVFYSLRQWQHALGAAGFAHLAVRPETEVRMIDGKPRTVEWLSSMSVAA